VRALTIASSLASVSRRGGGSPNGDLDHQQRRGGDHVGHALGPFEHPDLTDDVTVADRVEHVTVADDVGGPLLDHVELRREVTLAHELRADRIALLAREGGESSQLVRLELGEDGIAVRRAGSTARTLLIPQDGCAAGYSALTSAVISATEALASPNSSDVFGS